MSKKRTVLIVLAAGVAVWWVASAGTLEPPGPPAPTMATLLELYNKVGTGSSSPDTCIDNVGRFVVCGNGTVKDTLTGLYWLANASCINSTDWASASVAAEQLAHGQCGLTDGSSAGDWRLPTSSEMQALADQATTNGCTVLFVPDVVGTGCCATGTCAFGGTVQPNVYWSSTTNPNPPSTAFVMNWNNGIVTGTGKSFSSRAWPVRSGR